MADGRRTAGAADLLRTVGLLADGPVRWGAPARSTRAGVYLVELPAPLPRAPIDLSPVGTWIERVPTLLLDGARPSGKDLAARLAAFWLPDQVVLFVGSTAAPLGRRIDELVRTPLGDPAPHPDGRWVKTLRGLDQLRIWWADTDAPEEYEDGILSAFAEAVDPAAAAALHDPTVVVPFANMRTPTALPKEHGIAGDLLERAPVTELPPRELRKVVTLPPGNAISSDQSMTPRGRATGGVRRGVPSSQGAAAAAGSPAAARPAGAAPGSNRASGGSGRSAAPRTAAGARSAGTGRSASRSPRSGSVPARATGSGNGRAGTASPSGRAPDPVHLTEDGLRQLEAERDELVTVRRPEIIARVRAARELGDLSENADYEAARKEQSFAEGRIAQLESMIRNASIIDTEAGGDEVVLGSTVSVESGEGEETYTVVGSSEARPGEGRISNTSPIGQALLGHRVGDDVIVRAPMGDRHYTIREIR